MKLDINYLKEAGLDTKMGLGYTGGEDKYLAALQRYYKNYDKNKEKLETYFRAKDYENFMVTAHALKSNSRMIGAAELARYFETLENLAICHDYEEINRKTEYTMSVYQSLVEKLQPLRGSDEPGYADEITADEAKKTLDLLIAAVDDFDDVLALKLIEKLAGYHFEFTQKEQLKIAKEYIEEFMYDDAAFLIKAVSSAFK